MKTCPYCAEEIQDAAVVCKHCGRDLPTGPPSYTATAPKQPWSNNVKIAVGAGAAVLVLIIILANVFAKKEDPAVKAEKKASYEADLAFCQNYAAAQIEASNGMYFIGGGHYYDLVRKCQLDRATGN